MTLTNTTTPGQSNGNVEMTPNSPDLFNRLLTTRCICLFGFYDTSTFVSYLMPNPFLYKYTVLFQTIKFSIKTQFNCQIIQFSQTILIQTIQFSVSIVFVYTQLNVKTVLFQTIQFSVNAV